MLVRMFQFRVKKGRERAMRVFMRRKALKLLKKVPGCLCARRFRTTSAVSKGNHRYLALYHLASPEVCSSPAWKAAAETPWTVKLRPQMKDRLRIVLRRYERAAR